MKVILMRTPRKADMKSQLSISCCQGRFPVVGLGYIQLSWPSVSQGNPQTTLALAKTKELLSVDCYQGPIDEDNTHTTHGTETLMF